MLKILNGYQKHLMAAEKSSMVIDEYVGVVNYFIGFIGGQSITKEIVMSFKKDLTKHYSASSVNSMLVAVNDFLTYLGKDECRVRLARTKARLSDSEIFESLNQNVLLNALASEKNVYADKEPIFGSLLFL